MSDLYALKGSVNNSPILHLLSALLVPQDRRAVLQRRRRTLLSRRKPLRASG